MDQSSGAMEPIGITQIAPTSLLDLPSDILSIIFGHCMTDYYNWSSNYRPYWLPSHFPLLRVSHRVKDEVIPLLYRNVSISTPSRLAAFLQRPDMQSYKHVASLTFKGKTLLELDTGNRWADAAMMEAFEDRLKTHQKVKILSKSGGMAEISVGPISGNVKADIHSHRFPVLLCHR